jgi:pimeloyl-ACP methyl ester carboxylesterase
MREPRRQRGRLESRWLSTNSLRLHARVSVNAVPVGRPAIVLVHGLLVSSRYMVPTAERLALDWPVHAPDLPGYGKSTKPPRVLDVPALADALAAYVRAAGLGRVALLANSFGCQVAVDFAVRYPEHVERLILAGPVGDPRTRTAWQLAGLWLLNLPGEPVSLVPVVARDLLDMGPRRMLCTYRYLLADHVEEKLPFVRVPTLVVRGGRDTTVSQRWAETATALLPQGQLAVIRGAAHTINYNAADALVRLVRPFLLDRSPRRAEVGGHPAAERCPAGRAAHALLSGSRADPSARASSPSPARRGKRAALELERAARSALP